MLNLEIYTVGGIDFLLPVFKALVIFLGGSAVASFVKLFALSGLLFAIWISIFGKDKLFFVKHFLMAVFLVNLSFAPIVNLTIIDTKYNRIETVSNFPFLPGLFLSIGSVSADFFTNAIDSLFHTGTTVVWSGGSGSYLADLDYRNTGFLGSMDLMRRILSFRLRKVPEFNALQNMLYAYIEQCFFPYITTLNDSQLKDILTSRDLFSVMRVNGYLIEYNGSVYTCGEFYDNELTPRWNDLKLKLQNNPEVAGFVFEESLRVPGVVQALTRASYSFQDAVAQAGLINAVSYVLSAQNVDDYRLLSAYISGRAQEQSKLLWRGLGAFMADTLPKVRNYIIAIAVFFSFMLIPMMLLPFFGQTPGSVLVGFAKFIAWAWFWDPMLALLDAGTKIMAVQKTTAWLTNQSIDGISIATLAELVNDAEWYPAVAGYIAIAMVPTLSWLFFRGFDAGIAGIAYMFSGLAGGVREEFSRMTQNIQRDYLGSLTGELNSGTWAWRESYSGNIDSLTDIYRKEELANIYGSSLGYAQTRAHAEAVLDQERIGRGLGVEHGANRVGLTPQQIGFAGGFTSSVSTAAPYQVLGESAYVAKSYTDAERLLGAYQAWQGFVNKYFDGDSTVASRWMEGYSLLHNYGDLKAFENYVQEQGLDKYVGTRYGELLNETAKIYRELSAAGLMGRDPYTHFLAKHSDIHTTLQSRQDVLNLADALDRAGFGEYAEKLRSNPDRWIGADVTFVLAGGGIGAFSVRKEGEIISGSKEETYDISRDIRKVVVDREYVFNPGDISMVRTDPERFSSDVTDFIFGAYRADLDEGIARSKAAITAYLASQLENYLQMQRESLGSVDIKGGVGGTADKLLHTLIGMMKGAGFSKSKIEAILTKAGIAAEAAASLIKGETLAEGKVSDRDVANVTRLFAQELVDKLYEGIENMRKDGDLTRDEILKAVEGRFTPAVSSFLEKAEDIVRTNKAELAGQRFKSAGEEALRVLGDEVAIGAAGILLANLGPELAAKGIEVFKNLREKLGPEEFRKALRELDEFRDRLVSEVESRFGKRTAKYVDDFLKSVGREVIEGGRSIKEAVEAAKDTAVRSLVSRGVALERAERIVERIADAAGDVVDDAKSGWRSMLKGVFGGALTGILGDPKVIHPEMDMIKLGEFQREYGLRFDFRSGTFIVEDSVRFAPLAEKLGISSHGELSLEESKKVMDTYWSYVRNSY